MRISRVLWGLFFFSISSSSLGSSEIVQRTLGGPESVAKGRYQILEGTRGMVVSDDREASSWGAEILRQGGNAIDAMVATAFALAVTRPHYASLGGGGFMVYCPHPTKKGPQPCQTLDYREKAPAAASRDMFLAHGKTVEKLSRDGALASGVPGVTAGLLLALEKFGTFPRQKLLRIPIEIARKGYSFSSHSEKAALERWGAMNNAAKKIFGCEKGIDIPKNPCPPGTRIKQLDLAKVLSSISRLGVRGFYQGPVAKSISEGILKAGGLITMEDLRTYQPQFRPALQGEFLGHQIIAMPPPSSGGIIILQLLNYAERANSIGAFKNGFASSEAIHALAHAMSLSFADRAQYLGDPDSVQVPVSRLLSPQYLDQQWKSYRQGQANLTQSEKPLAPESQHTTHFSVIDRKGNSVSVTTTVNDNFGSGFVPPGTGIVMNDEMDDFSAMPGAPNLFGLVGNEANSIAPRKRPLSSMSPTIVRDAEGNVEIAIGAAGGPRIISAVFLSLLNRLLYKMTLPDAVAAPRFHQQWQPPFLTLESSGFGFETRAILKDKGYNLQEVPSLGKVQALERLKNGRTSGAPDPRSEGAAVAE